MKSRLKTGFFIILCFSLMLSFSQIEIIHGIRATRHLICADVDAVGQPLHFKNNYKFGAKQVISWVSLKNINAPHELRWKWLDPNKNLWTEDNVSVSSEPATQRVYSILDLSSHPEIFDNHGTWIVQFFIDDIYRFSDTFSIYPTKETETITTMTEVKSSSVEVTVVQHLMCKGLDESEEYKPIDIVDIFSSTDTVAYSYLLWEEGTPFILQWRWISPDSSITQTLEKNVDWSGSGWAWSKLLISGENRQVGTWNVEAYANSFLISTKQFTITSGGSSIISESDIELVEKSITPKGGKPIYPGDIISLNYKFKNNLETAVENIHLELEPLPNTILLLEKTPPTDITSGSVKEFIIKVKVSKEGTYSSSVLLYTGDIVIDEAPLTIQVSPTFWKNALMIGIAIAMLVITVPTVIILTKRRRIHPSIKTNESEYNSEETAPSSPLGSKYCM